MRPRLFTHSSLCAALIAAALAGACAPLPSEPPTASPQFDLAAARALPPTAPLKLVGSDFGFAPQQIQVPAGRRVPLVFENTGVVNHDWVVPALALQVVAKAGQTTTQEVIFEKPGEYDILCSLPFHSEFGMKGKVVVVADPNASVEVLEVSNGSPLPEGIKRLPLPAVAPPVNRTTPAVVPFELETTEVKALIDDGVATTYWTFGGTVPGPMMRVRQGDTVEVTLKNSLQSQETHSIDFHAATGPGGGGKHTQIPPGGKAQFSFKALNPGVYVYHCATPKVGAHIANGMYGMIVVEPPEGYPAVDREFYLMQGELYLKGERGTRGMREFSWEKLLQEQPEYVLMNGSVGAVSGENAFKANVGETVRVFFGVGGPNIVSSFHMIGEIFDRIYPEGASEIQTNVQTTLVPAGGATIVEAKLEAPGAFPLVDHSLGRLDKGNVAILTVEGAEQPDIFKTGPRVGSDGKDLGAGSGAH